MVKGRWWWKSDLSRGSEKKTWETNGKSMTKLELLGIGRWFSVRGPVSGWVAGGRDVEIGKGGCVKAAG